MGTAQAATVNPGSLKHINKKATAGAQGVALGWTYRAQKPTAPGTITIAVPAGFSAPQSATPSAPGYLGVTSGCAQFQVVGTAAQPDGSNVITVATDCADGQTATLAYGNVTVPTTPGTFAFPAAFTPAGGAAIPFADANTFTVSAGPLASLTVSPTTSTIAPGATQAYTARGFDAFGNAVALDPSGTRYSISPNGSCAGATCTATAPGTHTVTVKNKGIAATAVLTVGTAAAEADLAVTQTVDNPSPVYYDDVAFTTTVTNTSATTATQDVSVVLTIPAGLVTPVVTPSAATSYDPATAIWTIGDLAPGAQATLSLSALADDVRFGARTLTAAVSAATPDPVSANDTASATVTSRPAPVEVTITPDPANPQPIDVGVPGTVTWTASFANAANPAAPAPTGTFHWSCIGGNGEPCGDSPALSTPNILTLSLSATGLPIGEVSLYALFTPDAASVNYVQETASTVLVFTTVYDSPPPGGADLAVAQSVSSPSPVYYDDVTFTTTVTNTSATTAAQGVSAAVAIPAGLVTPVASPSGTTTYDSSTGVWTIGDLAPGAQATLTVSALAGDVALGAQTVSATVSAATSDPVPGNDTASATATPRPAPVAVVITPDPGNPPVIDISAPGTASWTASFVNAANPAAPAPIGVVYWTCETLSANPCPLVPALYPGANLSTLTLTMSSLQIDVYYLTAIFAPLESAENKANYVQEGVFSTVNFTTTISGGA
ncbi:DUF11 domain-containing protein [Frankia nepalensis]|uniref:DUF11 domain-containing protein n=1 Tax=Frankia nepalensis TaxID=1836974 RepID=UPI0027DC310A|nr:DUF11 domain-containing protein [Frankia nepalensis]